MHRILLSFVLASAVGAQSASYAYIDQKAPFTNPSVKLLTVKSLPRLGTTYRVYVPESWVNGNYTMGSDIYLAFGIRNPDFMVPGYKGWLYSSADYFLRVPNGTIPGWTTLGFPVPNSTQLIGAQFYQQVLVYSYTRTKLTRLLSRGVRCVIGK